MNFRVSFFRRRGLASVAVLTVLLAAGCATAPERPQIQYTGDPIIDGNAELAAAPKKDKILWDYRIAASALRVGNHAEAKAKLDDAISLMGGILANSADAKKARSLFSGEDAKTYIGEPYERCMAYYYRGLLYWQDGEPDNARACYRSAQIIAADSEAEHYAVTWVLLNYLDGLASVKQGGDGSDAFKRAQDNDTRRKLPAYNATNNVLVFAEYGTGPRKYAGGEYGEQLKFIVENSRAHSARLMVDGKTVRLPTYDDVSFQATTRGGRVMDYILNNKAVFKRTTDTVGDVALVGAAVAADNIYGPNGQRSQGAETAAIALAGVGLISKVFSSATTPKADTRTWDNLPQRLSFGSLQLPNGDYPAVVEFLDGGGHIIDDLTENTTIHVAAQEKDTVVFLSELKR